MPTELISPLLAYSLSGIVIALSLVALICLPYSRPKSPALATVLLLSTGAFNAFALMLHAIDTANDSSMLTSMLGMFGAAALLCTPHFWRFVKNTVWGSFVYFFQRYCGSGSEYGANSLTGAYYTFKPWVLLGVTFGIITLAAMLGLILCPLIWVCYVLMVYYGTIVRMLNSADEVEAEPEEEGEEEGEEASEKKPSKPIRLDLIGFGTVLVLGIVCTIGSLLHIPAMTISSLVARPILQQAYKFEADTVKTAAENKVKEAEEAAAKGEPLPDPGPAPIPVPVLTLNNGAMVQNYDTRTVFGREGYLSDLCTQSDESSNLQFYIFPSAEEGASICTWKIASCNTNNSDMKTSLNGQELTNDVINLSSGDTITLSIDGKTITTMNVSIR